MNGRVNGSASLVPRPAEIPDRCDGDPARLLSTMHPQGMLLAARGLDLRIAYASLNALTFLGLPPEEIIGLTMVEVLGVASTLAIVNTDGRGAASLSGGVIIRHPCNDRESLHARTHRFAGLLCVELGSYQSGDRPVEVQGHPGSLDLLTNLPNRRVLLDRLAMYEAGKSGIPACLIFIDIDRFKMVNDTLGHAAGDELLIQLGGRLIECAGPRHLVARLGGDEFVVFCEGIGMEEAREVAAAIVQSFQKPFLLSGKPFRCATSIGLAPMAGLGLSSIADILHAADSAMYAAKQKGGNQFVVFANPIHEELIRQIQLEQDLFHGIERGEMRVHFQAQISVDGLRLIGFEALLRWEHPIHGNISPVEFIPMAEYTGHIQAIGAWVLRQSLRKIGEWRALHNPDLFVAVNVSVKQLAVEDFAAQVQQALDEIGTPSEALHLEVTESMLMEPCTEPQLRAIQALGVKIAIDDFGTGYSSLSYLPRLAVSEVKLDRSFLEDVGKDERKTALFGAIVRMAHALDLVVVAEGIEDTAQLECIRECLCDAAQGYLLSRPLSAERVESLLLTEWKDGLLQQPVA